MTEVDLNGYHFGIAVDTSASMIGDRYNLALEIIGKIADIADVYDQREPGGIDVWTFDAATRYFANVTESTVKSVLPASPTGVSTHTGKMLQAVWDQLHVETLTNPYILIVLTDGEAHDRDTVLAQLQRAAAAAANPDGTNIGVGFWQLGEDVGATEFLQYLDNNGTTPDIVDTKSQAQILSHLADLTPLLHAIVLD